jgi:hypothetical protein
MPVTVYVRVGTVHLYTWEGYLTGRLYLVAGPPGWAEGPLSACDLDTTRLPRGVAYGESS